MVLRYKSTKYFFIFAKFFKKIIMQYEKYEKALSHHEPLCFDALGAINVAYVNEIYTLVIRYIDFLGYRSNELLYGVETPLSTIEKIDKLSKTC